MAMQDLIKEIESRFHKMDSVERVRKLRELASESVEDKAFIREHFPCLYEEVFPAHASTSQVTGWSGSTPTPSLCAKRK